jgi:hypothetical protein
MDKVERMEEELQQRDEQRQLAKALSLYAGVAAMNARPASSTLRAPW